MYVKEDLKTPIEVHKPDMSREQFYNARAHNTPTHSNR